MLPPWLPWRPPIAAPLENFQLELQDIQQVAIVSRHQNLLPLQHASSAQQAMCPRLLKRVTSVTKACVEIQLTDFESQRVGLLLPAATGCQSSLQPRPKNS